MGRKSKSNLDLPQEEPLTVTRSGRTIIKPNPVVTNTPVKKTTKTNKKLKESSDEEDSSSENEEPILENQKNKKKKDSTTTSTVNRKEKKPTTPKKKQQQKLKESDDEDDSSSSSSPSITPPKSSNTSTKKYTLEELDIITRENRIVYIKFFIFSILMVVVPLLAFKIFNTTVGDYLGISRQDRVTYAGVASLCGLILVMAAYSVMAYFEK
ncbi:hypothetical protein DDB_G0271358 [Dictyostelium discoideum AX4]|uniref:Uncharacterized protein n=1 Tax=Dictyostelium discoideum TaxID=44689 RepID=Q55BH7_DICDI|nr:hypothetical protein DDB_G0271358 [Dictyostelium discoideum AX4]EAL71809.2 hypothetical protein DDB_G0271358 [Dictyostelium discoideum AX4]|eukprot:XP_645635.2 hypothetical protein DDB_G0271358 [Dictyostelium discoideum AX4]